MREAKAWVSNHGPIMANLWVSRFDTAKRVCPCPTEHYNLVRVAGRSLTLYYKLRCASQKREQVSRTVPESGAVKVCQSLSRPRCLRTDIQRLVWKLR